MSSVNPCSLQHDCRILTTQYKSDRVSLYNIGEIETQRYDNLLLILLNNIIKQCYFI